MDYFETGFAVRTPSWHGKESLLQEAPTLDTWREAAGLTWEPVKVPLYLPAPIEGMDEEGAPIFGKARESGTFAVVRNDRVDGLYSDDKATRDRAILARGVSEDFHPIEHERDMTPIIEALGQACQSMGVGWEFTTAGSVREGRQVYAAIMLDRPIEVPGDDSLTLPFGTLLNSHDGTGAFTGGLTATRVVCANTYKVADDELGRTVSFSVRHTGDVATRLEEARMAIGTWLDAFENYAATCNAMATTAVDEDITDAWIEEFLPVIEARMTARQVENRRGEQAVFRSIIEEAPTTEGIRGTAFGLWQASIEFLDHYRVWRTQDSYLRRTLLEPVPAKAMARDRIMALAGAGAN